MVYKVVLNIYDLSPYNSYFIKIGLGAYHTGVMVNGTEYTYGGNQYTVGTGVFEHPPKQVEAIFRTSIELGHIDDLRELRDVLSDIKPEYKASQYDLMKQN